MLLHQLVIGLPAGNPSDCVAAQVAAPQGGGGDGAAGPQGWAGGNWGQALPELAALAKDEGLHGSCSRFEGLSGSCCSCTGLGPRAGHEVPRE
jgi:hypothetical protein